MIHVFILSYIAIDQLARWLPKENFSEDIVFHIIDNGNQKIPQELSKYVMHVCKENIFCAGGYNLAMKIGFEYLKQDKILITADDTVYNEAVVRDCYRLATENTVSGARYDHHFYSFMGLHKNIYKEIGPWDENCFYGTCEDNDFNYRCSLKGIKNISAGHMIYDSHASSPAVSYKYGNLEYVQEKWDNLKSKVPLTPKFRKEYWSYFKEGPYEDFMSEIEYKRFIASVK